MEEVKLGWTLINSLDKQWESFRIPAKGVPDEQSPKN